MFWIGFFVGLITTPLVAALVVAGVNLYTTRRDFGRLSRAVGKAFRDGQALVDETHPRAPTPLRASERGNRALRGRG